MVAARKREEKEEEEKEKEEDGCEREAAGVWKGFVELEGARGSVG